MRKSVVFQLALCVHLWIWAVLSAQGQSNNGMLQNVAGLVNPFIGTGKCDTKTKWGNYGGTYPGAVSPWGMVQLTPETSVRPSEKGYYYEDSLIRGFSCSGHCSGYPNGSSGQTQILFLAGKVNEIVPSYEGRSFTHATEHARPGYYSVWLDDTDQVEMTATTRAGLFRYQSDSEWTTLVICKAGHLELKGDTAIQAAYHHTDIRFNKAWDQAVLRNDTAYLTFRHLPRPIGLLVKVAVSSTGFAGSRLNGDAEIPGWDFDAVSHSVYNRWNEELKTVEIVSSGKEDAEKFYTALYHSFLLPWIVSDVDGKYTGDDRRIYQTEGKEAYGEFSSWDTFRTLHPLLSLLKPERQQDMIRSMMASYRATGVLPKGPMTGLHTIPVLVDAYLKGAAVGDPKELYQAMQAYYVAPDHRTKETEQYLRQGFLDASQEKSVSITTELAYNDWVLSRFAQLLGLQKDAQALTARSFNYRNLFDEQSLFICPRDSDSLIHDAGELGYQESDKWTASYFVPHNIQDIINLSGGPEAFTAHLKKGYQEGFILHDNEPVFHYPSLFTYASDPATTSQVVHEILNTAYSTTPGGIPGNDDLGSMSSWFVFNAMGLYPACPGIPEYTLSTPLFPHIRIHLPSGKHICLSTTGDTGKQVAYSSLSLDNKPYKKLFITHNDLLKGGELIYALTGKPDNFSSYIHPFSETKEIPDFRLSVSSPSLKQMKPDQKNTLCFTVMNKGAKGTFFAEVYDNDQLIASKRLLVNPEESVTDTLSFTLYKEGAHQVRFEKQTMPVWVEEAGQPATPFICTEIRIPPLAHTGDTLLWDICCKNISGRTYTQEIPLWIADKVVATKKITLSPGEERFIQIPVRVDWEGFTEVKALDRVKRIKGYAKATDACVLYPDFTSAGSGLLPDLSGFDNQGEPYGSLLWGRQGGQATVQTGTNAYITFPRSESLQYTGNALTISTWLFPQERPHGYADFFTKGDYSLFKMEGPNALAFFAGGWGRGTCNVKVPDNWYTAWHHIAGVCTGSSLKLFIDGCLIQEIQIEGNLEPTELPWNLGRNAEMPYSRFFNCRFAGLRIFGAALSDADIRDLYLKDCEDFKE